MCIFTLYSIKEILELTLKQKCHDNNKTVQEHLYDMYLKILKEAKNSNGYIGILDDQYAIKFVGNKLKVYKHMSDSNKIGEDGASEFVKKKLPNTLYHFLMKVTNDLYADYKHKLNSQTFHFDVDIEFSSDRIYKLYFNLSRFDRNLKSDDHLNQTKFLEAVITYLDNEKRYILHNNIIFSLLRELGSNANQLLKSEFDDKDFITFLKKLVEVLYNKEIFNMKKVFLKHPIVDCDCFMFWDNNINKTFIKFISYINFIKKVNNGIINENLVSLLVDNILDSKLKYSLIPNFAYKVLLSKYILNEEYTKITLRKGDFYLEDDEVLPEYILKVLLYAESNVLDSNKNLINLLLYEIDFYNYNEVVEQHELFYLKSLSYLIHSRKIPDYITFTYFLKIAENNCKEFELQRKIFSSQINSYDDTINTKILPRIILKNTEFLTLKDENISIDELLDKIQNESCLIISSGGMGKTTMAKYLLKKYLTGKLNKAIFYIDLNKINTINLNSNTNKNAIFIILANQISNCSDLDFELIVDLIRQDTMNKPLITLLLDGLNEIVYHYKDKVIRDIQEILLLDNIQVIVLSRNTEVNLDFRYIGKLMPLEYEIINDYLKCNKISPSQYENNSKLMQLLTIPYFLTKLSKIRKPLNKSNPITRGIFLDNYYSSQLTSYEYKKFNRKTKYSLKFYFDLLMPYISYHAEKENNMIISILSLNKYLDLLIKFTKSQEEKSTIYNNNECLQILSCYQNNRKEFIKVISEDLVHVLSIFEKEISYDNYSISSLKYTHQITRDYFSAKFYMQLLKKTKDKEILLNYFGSSLLSLEVCEILNDLDYNQHVDKLLSIAEELSFEKNYYILSNLFNIWTYNRSKIIIKNFKHIDFRSFDLFPYIFSENNRHSEFYECTLSTSQFMPNELGNILNGAVFNPINPKQFIVASTDKIIKEFDLSKSYNAINTYISSCGKLENVIYSHDGAYILACGWDNRAEEFEIGLNKYSVRTYLGHGNIVTRAVYSPDDCYVLTTSTDGNINEYDRKTEQLITSYTIEKNVEINNAYYNSKGTKFVASYSDGYVREWKIQRKKNFHVETKPLMEYRNHEKGCAFAMYSHDDKKIVSGGADETLVEIPCGDFNTKNIFLNLRGAVTGLLYDFNSEHIYICSTDPVIIRIDCQPFRKGKITMFSRYDYMSYLGHVGTVEDIDIRNDELISAGCDEIVIIHDNKESIPKANIRIYDSLYHGLLNKNEDYIIIYSETMNYLISINLITLNIISCKKDSFNFGIKKVINYDKNHFIVLTTDGKVYEYDFIKEERKELKLSDIYNIYELNGKNKLIYLAIKNNHKEIIYFDKSIGTKMYSSLNYIESLYNINNRIYFIDSYNYLYCVYIQYEEVNFIMQINELFNFFEFYTFHENTFLVAYCLNKLSLFCLDSHKTIYEKELKIKKVFNNNSYVMIYTLDKKVFCLTDTVIIMDVEIDEDVVDLMMDDKNVYCLTENEIACFNEKNKKILYKALNNNQNNGFLKMKFNYNNSKIIITHTDNTIVIIDLLNRANDFSYSLKFSFNIRNCIFKQCAFLDDKGKNDLNTRFLLDYYGAKIE